MHEIIVKKSTSTAHLPTTTTREDQSQRIKYLDDFEKSHIRLLCSQ